MAQFSAAPGCGGFSFVEAFDAAQADKVASNTNINRAPKDFFMVAPLKSRARECPGLGEEYTAPAPADWTQTATLVIREDRRPASRVPNPESPSLAVDRRDTLAGELRRRASPAGVVFDEVGELALSDRGLRVAGGFVEPRATLE